MRSISVLLCVFLFSLSSCEKKEGIKQNKININIGSEPATLDPRKSRSLREKNIVQMLFEGLTRIGEKGQIELALAASVTSNEEGTSYLFSLKEAYWSNGDRIKPEDFVYAWQTALSPDFVSPNAYQLFCLKNGKEIKLGNKPVADLGVYVIDDHTVQVDLEGPIPYFLHLLASPIFFPVHPKMKEEEIFSSGPFCLQEWKHNDHIEVVKNPKYREADTVRLDSIYMVMVEEEAEIKMFEQGELDWAGSPLSSLSVDVLAAFAKEGLLQSAPMQGTCFFRLNTREAPLHNEHIRQALALAIDRQSIVEHITQGGQRIALSLVPGSAPCFADGDQKLAQHHLQLGLQELGCSIEQLPPLVLLYSVDQRNHRIMQAVQHCWKRFLGLNVSLEANESKVVLSRLRGQEYQIAVGSWIADYDDAENFLEVFKYRRDSTNNTNWENGIYAQILDDSRLKKGRERDSMLAHCEQILMKEMPIIPLYHTESLYIKNPHLQKVIVSPLGIIDFRLAYFDREEKR